MTVLPLPPETAEPDQAVRSPLLRLEGVGIRDARGWLARAVALDVHDGELVTLTGPAHGARTLLLLAAAGRLRPDEGRVVRAETAALDVALATIAAVNDLDDALSVADTLRERQAVAARGIDWPRVLARAGLPESTRHQDVAELGPADRILLGVALALSEDPSVLIVDDVDSATSVDDAHRAWAALRQIADDGTAVLAGALDVSPLADRSYRV